MNVQNLKSQEQKDPGLRQDMLTAIREKYESLSRSHQRIGNYILEHPREVVYLSITELAERAGVGEATVSRFCWILGLHGFQELKLSLAQDTAGMDGQPKPVSLEISPNSSLTSAIGQRIAQVVSATLESIDEAAMDRACELLVTARKIDFYGVGTSGIAALDASQMFLGMGKFSAAYADPHIQVMSAALLTQEDVAVAFSHSGSTKDTVTALRKAQESGATTISITSYARSPITQVSDLVLLASFGEKRVITSMYSKIGVMVVLERLLAGCLMKMEPEAKKASQKIISAILDKMY
jgi:DNA-binding MurR/RpiR family transcriptional regulator